MKNKNNITNDKIGKLMRLLEERERNNAPIDLSYIASSISKSGLTSNYILASAITSSTITSAKITANKLCATGVSLGLSSGSVSPRVAANRLSCYSGTLTGTVRNKRNEEHEKARVMLKKKMKSRRR